MNIRTIITSLLFSESQRKNRPVRILAWFSLATIVSTPFLLLRLAKTNSNFAQWHFLCFIVSCAGCVYIIFMVYYVKAQRNRARKANEEQYRSIIAISDIGVWEFHSETGYLWCSPEYFKMLGYTENNFLKNHGLTIDSVWIDMLHPDDRDAAVEHFNAFSKGTNNYLYENTFRLRHRKGNWIWVLSRSKALGETDGSRSKVMLGSHIDITEKIATQIALRKRNQKLMRFAFFNAHHVHGPVARMLGLVELVKIDTETDCWWYVQTISNEVKDLDRIIKSIGKELEEIGDDHD